jgi:glycosyltransferase involved in cell wall biosynthesis
MPGRTIGVMGRVLDQEGGLGVYARCLLPELLNQDPHSRYVIFLNSDNSRDILSRFPNAEPHVLPAKSKLYWDQVTVALAARRLGVDLIFNPKFSIPLLSGRPCVFVQQGSDWYVNPQNYEWWDNLYMRMMLPLFSRKARRTLAISQATLNDLAKYAHIDVSNSVVSYAGVAQNMTPERDPNALGQFRTKHRLPQRFILTVTRAYHSAQHRLIPYPGGNDETLIRAYRRYRERGGELPLVVVGFRIEEFLRERGFSDRELADVQFLGLVPNTEIHLAYQSAECFVLASLCESFGIKILEALATGCPAIVPSTCGSPEIAGGAARLINPHNEEEIAQALAEVTGSEELRRTMREKGLQRAQALTWRETARRTLAVFDEIIPRPVAADGGVSEQMLSPAG